MAGPRGVRGVRPPSDALRVRAPQPPRALRVAIVDDHPVVRKGLSHLINDEPDMAVCGESASPAGALTMVDTARPDLVIVDLTLGGASGLDGLELVKALAASHPSVRVLVLSMRDELVFAERALRAGAGGYVMKHEAIGDLLTAVRRVAAGKTYVSERVSERFLAGLTGRRTAHAGVSPVDRLTDREREVFELIGRGLGTRAIARQLEVAVKTVESHHAHIKEKLGLDSVRQLVRVAVSWAESE
jgi:DNA-binding NarL/FixJ family response regulator